MNPGSNNFGPFANSFQCWSWHRNEIINSFVWVLLCIGSHLSERVSCSGVTACSTITINTAVPGQSSHKIKERSNLISGADTCHQMTRGGQQRLAACRLHCSCHSSRLRQRQGPLSRVQSEKAVAVKSERATNCSDYI